jgi:hypothetical protein
MKTIVLAAVAAVALSLGTVSADAKKKKKQHHHRPYYSQGFHPNYYPNTNAGYNQCQHDQFRYPALDIRC